MPAPPRAAGLARDAALVQSLLFRRLGQPVAPGRRRRQPPSAVDPRGACKAV